jgi:hypothetical protein
LAQIAASKRTSGMGVYAVIKKLETKPEAMKPGGSWTAETVEETFSGTGLGNKTIDQVIKEMQLDADLVYHRLRAIDVEPESSDRLKALAEKYNTTPIKLMTTMLVDDGRTE